jgi:LmbE family N-acetylglucosaminyl deacetylase
MILVAMFVAVSVVVLTSFFLAKRQSRYMRFLNYDPAQDCVAGIGGPLIETISVPCEKDGFILPDLEPGITGALLELTVKTTRVGRHFDPALEIEAVDFSDVQVIDRGACGKRFFNLSRLLSRATARGQKVRLRGRHMSWKGTAARLHLCREQLSSADRVVIVAPHPDDAEIAAFGVYTDTGATVVTLTAGDNSDRYRAIGPLPCKLSRGKVARIRVWDSISIPELAGIHAGSAVNLCFPDGRLADMRAEPNRDFRGAGDEALDFGGLRALSRSPLVRPATDCSWNALVEDLRHIFTTVQPTVVVMPHPALDPHDDHMAATAAAVEALSLAGLTHGRLFLSCVHNRSSKLWPFGPAGSGVAHLPVLASDSTLASGFYSHPLSEDRQIEKYIALEAMHDIREMDGTFTPSLSRAGKAIRAELRAVFDGLGDPPASYLRRAVRPDETFFVMNFDAIKNLKI